MIVCKYWGKQYIDSATSFKERFRIHKSDINTAKIRCGVPRLLLHICKSATCETEYLLLQLTEHVFVRQGEDTDNVLWDRKILANSTLYFNTWIK